jgi:hypothetical protein
LTSETFKIQAIRLKQAVVWLCKNGKGWDDTLHFIGSPKMALNNINRVKFTSKNFFSRAVKSFVCVIEIGFSALFASSDYTFTTTKNGRCLEKACLL